MRNNLERNTFYSESCIGSPREVEVYFEYEPAWPGTRDVQGTGVSVDVFKVVYKGRNVTRLLTKAALEFFREYLIENYNDPYEKDAFDYEEYDR